MNLVYLKILDHTQRNRKKWSETMIDLINLEIDPKDLTEIYH